MNNYKIYKNILFVIIVIFSYNKNINCQEILISDKIPSDFSLIDNDFGPNRKAYNYHYFNIGNIINIDNEEMPVRWNSIKISSGRTNKRKLTNWLSGLLSIDLSLENFNIKNIDSTTLIQYTPSVHKAKYMFYKISTDLALQFNFNPKRGNQLGKYITLGGYADYNFVRRMITRTETKNNKYKNSQKNTYKKISSLSPFQYGTVLKLGNHNVAIFAKYRLSDIFKNKQTELPRLIAGIEIIFHDK